MRKEVKEAVTNARRAVELLRRVADKDTAPPKVKERATAICIKMEENAKEAEEILRIVCM